MEKIICQGRMVNVIIIYTIKMVPLADGAVE